MPRKHPKSNKAFANQASHRPNKNQKQNLTWLWVGLGIFIVIAAGIALLNSATSRSAELSISPPAEVVEISAAQANSKYQQGAFFLDVRSREEFSQFHIKGSRLIPLDQLPNRLRELPKDKEVVIVCLSGHRSLSGATILRQAGFKQVFSLIGGLQAWMDANYPVEKGTP